jgi:uncharacterized protein YjbI with pentapeptide repeats
MNQEILDRILKKHRVWLKSDGKEGKEAYLYGLDLRGLNLEGANLGCVNFVSANLRGT